MIAADLARQQDASGIAPIGGLADRGGEPLSLGPAVHGRKPAEGQA